MSDTPYTLPMTPSSLEAAADVIDAAVFSSDLFVNNPRNRARLQQYLRQWLKQLTEDVPLYTPVNAAEARLVADFAMILQESFQLKNGRPIPKSDVEFAGMLGIAYMLGRESIQGAVTP